MRVHIEGRVQGVGYRYWAVEQANELQIDGWVRNLRDGRVEMVVSGPKDVLDEILRRCLAGPSFAKVDTVTAAPETDPVAPGFRALPNG